MGNSEEGYVTIRINRSDGTLKDIIFTDKGGKEDKPAKTTLGHGKPVEVNANVQVLDSITWYKSNPVCVRHDGYVV